MAVNLALAQANNIKQQEYWDNRLLEMIKLEKSNFVFSTFGREVIIPKNEGTTTYSVRRYNSLPVRSLDTNGEMLAEGVANDPLKIEAHKVQADIDQFGAYIEITDWVKDIHMDDVKTIYQPELARHAAEVVERNIISKFVDASEYFAGGVALSGLELESTDVLKMDDLRRIALYMKVNKRQGNPRFNGKPVAVLHPFVMSDLLDDEVLLNRMLLPGQENTPIKTGTLQSYQFYGMFVTETLIAEERTAAAIATELEQTGANLAALEALDNTDVAVGDIYLVGSTLYVCATATSSASTWSVTPNFHVYTSYVLGKDPYVIMKFGQGGLEWKMTDFSATKDDPLGQKATFGYRLWTGAKVIDPIAICKVYSRTAYDVADLVDLGEWEDVWQATASQA